jgi:predicted AlkP superfamily pyrophosphatase or phosphodiesterase
MLPLVTMLCALLTIPAGGSGAAGGPVKPKLVVVITVDQFRADYLTRWKPQLTGGFALLEGGAVFTNAFQDHAVTETAPGHATVLSGRWPAHTGIMTNTLGVGDATAPLLGVSGPGASPQRFRGTAFFDWLHAAEPKSRALSVSRKDRGAILPVGRARQEVYWYQGGRFTTSRYYRDSLPVWVQAFNALRIPFKAAGLEYGTLLPDSAYAEPDSQPWENGGHDLVFPHYLPTDSSQAAYAYAGIPAMDSLTLAFALAGAEAMRLGRRGPTDLLAVSLSTTDAIGHVFGPNSRELHDQVVRLDRYLGWFLDRLMRRYGKDNLLVVLTSDHGVTPYPEYLRLHGDSTAQRVNIDTLVQAVNQDLDHRMGAAAPMPWFIFDSGILFLRDNGLLAARGIRTDSLLHALADRIRTVAGVARVDFPDSLSTADTAADPVARRWLHQIVPDADVALVVTLVDRDSWGYGGGIVLAMHGQPTDRDAHVPMLFWGKGIRPGFYGDRAGVVDIAPTLARLLGITPLAVPDGRVLTEALEP